MFPPSSLWSSGSTRGSIPSTKHEYTASHVYKELLIYMPRHNCPTSKFRLLIPITWPYFTTFSVTQFEQRGSWQLGQFSVLIGIGVYPQQHCSSISFSTPFWMIGFGLCYTRPKEYRFLLALRGRLLGSDWLAYPSQPKFQDHNSAANLSRQCRKLTISIYLRLLRRDTWSTLGTNTGCIGAMPCSWAA